MPMLRWYIIIVVVMCACASLLGRVPDTKPTAQDTSTTSDSAPTEVTAESNRQASLNPLDRSIELARTADGYFYADVKINGVPVHMLVDTGATTVALSRNDAQMAGISTSIGMSDVVGQGADGAVHGQEVTLQSVSLGDKTVEGLPALVLNNGGQSLLGQSFLSKFSSVHIEGERMILR